jgi:hypothetical protein
VAITFTEDRRRTAEEGQRAYGLQGILTVEQIMDMPGAFSGSVEQIAEQMIQRRERYGFSYFTALRDGDALAPVVARLAGT